VHDPFILAAPEHNTWPKMETERWLGGPGSDVLQAIYLGNSCVHHEDSSMAGPKPPQDEKVWAHQTPAGDRLSCVWAPANHPVVFSPAPGEERKDFSSFSEYNAKKILQNPLMTRKSRDWSVTLAVESGFPILGLVGEESPLCCRCGVGIPEEDLPRPISNLVDILGKSFGVLVVFVDVDIVERFALERGISSVPDRWGRSPRGLEANEP